MSSGEVHYVNRAGWLRAAVLGGNDGLTSTASLVVGVAASEGSRAAILTAAFAGWAAGAMSMAAGEYVSVSSQADLESADLERERRALKDHPREETEELAEIYRRRGLTAPLANEVAKQLMARDAVGAHARDELGLSGVQLERWALPVRIWRVDPGPGGSGVRHIVFRRRRSAHDRRDYSAARLDAALRLRLDPGFPPWARCAGGMARRRAADQTRLAGRILGGARDGGHCGNWRACRPSRLIIVPQQ